MATTSKPKNVAGVGAGRIPGGASSDPVGKGHGNRISPNMGGHGNAQKSGTPNVKPK
jgi:hypothetical protein